MEFQFLIIALLAALSVESGPIHVVIDSCHQAYIKDKGNLVKDDVAKKSLNECLTKGLAYKPEFWKSWSTASIACILADPSGGTDQVLARCVSGI